VRRRIHEDLAHKADGGDAGNRRQLVDNLVLGARHAFGFRYQLLRNRNPHRLHLLRLRESRSDGPQRIEGANHQAGAHEEDERERYLHHDQAAAHPLAFLAGAGGPAASEIERGARRGVPDGRQQSEQHTRKHRQEQRKDD
jgi:hypothetical protein